MEEEQITGVEEKIEQDPVDNNQDQVELIQENVDDYMEIYSDQIELTNHLLSGQIFFLGLIFGVLLFKVFWDRWKI